MTQGLLGGVVSSITQTQGKPTPEGFVDRGREKLYTAVNYVRSYYWAQQSAEVFRDVQSYCLFVGHARSGGSLVGALIDAHPNAIIADEVDVFPYVAAKFSREQVFHILLRRSRIQAQRGREKSGREKQQYSYRVSGQWQGTHETLRVIGNRKAGISTQQIRRDPALFSSLRQLLGESIALKTIACIRNPFDTISTMSIRSGRELAKGVDAYFANCATIETLQKGAAGDEICILRHEDLLENPESVLAGICQFLGIPDHPEYLRACAGILYASPAKSRSKTSWSPELIEIVTDRIQQYGFLQGYSYEA